MAKIILFGIGDMAELAHFYLSNDSEHEIVSFCLRQKDMPEKEMFLGLPIVSLESVESKYSKDNFCFFAPLSSEKMNTIREDIYNRIKDMGYKMISYVSSKSIVYNSKIGDNCFIQAGNVLHPFTKVGNNVMLWSSNLVGHHGEIKNHVTFASHVALAGNCIVGENCYLGTNSTVRDGITLAKGTLVGIATVITKNTEEWSVYLGNPAKKIGKDISKSILKI